MRRPIRAYVRQRFNANRERVMNVRQHEQEQAEREQALIRRIAQEQRNVEKTIETTTA